MLAGVKPGSAARLGALALLWGSSFLWIKFALRGVSPVQLTAARLFIGAVLLLAVVRARGLRLPTDVGTWAALALTALFANAVPYTLFGIGEHTVDSAVAGAINAATPLCTFAFGMSAGVDRAIGPRRLVGLVLGLVGVLVLLEPWHDAHGSLRGSLACLGAALSYGFSYVYAGRRVIGRGHPTIVLAAAQLTAATGLMVVALPFAGHSAVHLHPKVLLAVVMLGVGGTGLAYILSYRLLADEGAGAASTVTYLMPPVSVVLGALVLDEPLHRNLVVGAVVVLVGVALAQRPRAQVAIEPA
jgi:drug/metabolite transporter (DMT)-like permease